ncbi:MAG TPA: hypothetical protein VJU78_02540, partial [Chitinophagaceae bacterium]|nr:hypothetical protein [Chitinophagaceae bacterium]
MKKLLLSLLSGLSALISYAQLDSMGSHVNFTIDGDTKTGYSKFGPPIGTVNDNDDWFSVNPYSGIGRSIIDTSNAEYYKARLQAGENFTFVKRMSVPVYAVIYPPMPPKFWVDALYSRDNAYLTDSSIFSTGAKNGGNPNNWPGGVGNVPVKTDIIDAYAHTRTSGINPTTDSVWFMAGVSTVGTNGSRYFDIEVYRENFSYDKTTQKFVTPGTANGHSAWTFDASGNVTRTGDIIISVTYNPGSAPLIDYRIWVSDSTFANVSPVKFIFSG